jgi:hypothetical protein
LTQTSALGLEVIAKAAAIANEYYSQLRAHKFAITRPQKIPLSLSECVEKVRTRWKQIIVNAAELNAKAAEDLLAVVCERVAVPSSRCWTICSISISNWDPKIGQRSKAASEGCTANKCSCGTHIGSD